MTGPLAGAPRGEAPPAAQEKPAASAPEQSAPSGPAAPAEEAAGPSSYAIAEAESFLLSEPEDVGPAGPMAASSEGIFFITKGDGMYLARRKGDSFSAISAEREEFFRYGRGPALTKNYAYWISASGRLARSKRTPSTTEYLGPARSGARVHSLGTAPDSVAYLAEDGDVLRAMIWTEGKGAKVASPEGASITSLDVIAVPSFPKLLMLEGRSGLSPLHLRTVRFRKGGPELGPSSVLWVGPGSQPLTEVHGSTLAGTGGVALIATAKDIVTFGVAVLTLDQAAQSVSDPVWVTYPNGIDPAPIAIERACGETLVFYAIPSEPKPRAPQELRVARLGAAGFQKPEVLVRARAFNEISVAPLEGEAKPGVVVAFTADHRTWALTVRCKPQNATK